jgi:hypothetical protein
MFRETYRSSSGALTVFAASGLYTHVAIGRCPGWVGTPFPTQPGQRPVNTWVYKPEAANSLELLMMSGMPLETCWAFNKFWNNKFYYKFTSCWLFILIHTTMHGSMNIKKYIFVCIYCCIVANPSTVETSHTNLISSCIHLRMAA